MLVKEVIVLVFVCTKYLCSGNFVIPEITLEALDPKGFRVSIPALNGIQLFAFHGNVNKEIKQVEPGDYHEDFLKANGNTFTYYNPNLELKVGDVVHYWVFIQHDKLGYRRDNQQWKVTELIKFKEGDCDSSSTSSVTGRSVVCKDSVIFEDLFDSTDIDERKWTIEQYIPSYVGSLDYEFVSYQDKPIVRYSRNGALYIKPKYAQNDEEVYGELDLRNKCTRTSPDECHLIQQIYLIIPPVTSAKLVSNFKFRYGKIEIKAKLPAGDWIYPQVYLEQVNDPRKKLWIAYARGNNKLLANNGEDVGGSLLFGGPVLTPEEPSRSRYLKSKRSNKPFTGQMHVYTVIWTKDDLTLLVDGEQYGKIDKEEMSNIAFSENEMVRIVLGVGVGGINDFPDGFRSGNEAKPWINKDSKQVRNFFLARNKWIQTWIGDDCALKVDYVKVFAL